MNNIATNLFGKRIRVTYKYFFNKGQESVTVEEGKIVLVYLASEHLRYVIQKDDYTLIDVPAICSGNKFMGCETIVKLIEQES